MFHRSNAGRLSAGSKPGDNAPRLHDQALHTSLPQFNGCTESNRASSDDENKRLLRNILTASSGFSRRHGTTPSHHTGASLRTFSAFPCAIFSLLFALFRENHQQRAHHTQIFQKLGLLILALRSWLFLPKGMSHNCRRDHAAEQKGRREPGRDAQAEQETSNYHDSGVEYHGPLWLWDTCGSNQLGTSTGLTKGPPSVNNVDT